MKFVRNIFAGMARRRLGQRLEVVGTPRIDTSSTLLLSNHISLDDYHLIAATFKGTIQEIPRVVLRDDVFHPEEKEGGEPLHNPKTRCRDMLKHKLFYLIAEKLGDAIPIRRTDSAYPPGNHTPRKYLEAIRNGEDVLMFPTGKISRDGSIDYVSSYNTPFKDEDIKKLMSKYHHLHVAFIHLMRDPVFDQYCVTLGNSYNNKDSESLSFVGELGKCTSLSGLQVFHFIQEKDMGIGLKEAILRLRDQRYIVVPNRTASEIEARVLAFNPLARHPEEDIALNKGMIEVASHAYQFNSLKHISKQLESVLQ